MKSEILSEIRRVKEIMGITPQLVNEQFAAYLKSIAKSGKAELKAELKNYLKTYADAMGVSVDEALEAFEKDYSEALLTGYPDIQIQKVFDDYFGVVSKEYADDLVGIYARTAPLEFGREVVGVEMGKGSMPVYDKFMKPETKLTEKNIEQAQDYLRYVESVRDNISPLTQTDRYAIESLDEFAQTLEGKIKEFNKRFKSLDELYDDFYKVEAEKIGKKPIPKEKFDAQVKSMQIKLAGKSDIEIIEQLIQTAPDKQNAIQLINSAFRKKGGVGDAAELAADGTIKVTSKGIEWLKTLGKVGLPGLVVIGIYLLAFNPDFFVDLQQKYRQAGSKYNDTYNALGERLRDSFYNLPDEVKFFISQEFSIDQAKKSETIPYITSISFRPSSQSEAGKLTIKMSNDSVIEYETSDNKSFTKIKKEGEAEVGTVKTEEEFKAAAKNGGFDIGKSFVKQTDTKYWGVDTDDSESTTEWNGTTFIVTSGHI